MLCYVPVGRYILKEIVYFLFYCLSLDCHLQFSLTLICQCLSYYFEVKLFERLCRLEKCEKHVFYIFLWCNICSMYHCVSKMTNKERTTLSIELSHSVILQTWLAQGIQAILVFKVIWAWESACDTSAGLYTVSRNESLTFLELEVQVVHNNQIVHVKGQHFTERSTFYRKDH